MGPWMLPQRPTDWIGTPAWPPTGSLPKKFVGLPKGIGSTYSAVALRVRVTSPRKALEKYCGTFLSVMTTLHRCSPDWVVVIVMLVPAVKPFFLAVSVAATWAAPKFGIWAAQARAAASAPRWSEAARAYQEAMSMP